MPPSVASYCPLEDEKKKRSIALELKKKRRQQKQKKKTNNIFVAEYISSINIYSMLSSAAAPLKDK